MVLTMSMSKKNVTLIVIFTFIVLVALVIWFLVFHDRDDDFSYRMTGVVTKVENGIVTVEGLAISSKENSTRQEPVVVRVTINSGTVLTKKMINLGFQDENGVQALRQASGSIGDLTLGTHVAGLKTEENLFEVKEVTALELDYINYEYSQ